MKITKGWFYFLSDFSGNIEISVIDTSDKVVIFDDWKNSVNKIEVLWNTDLKIFWFIKTNKIFEIIWSWKSTKVLANYLFMWENDNKIDVKLNWKIKNSWNNLEINILALLKDKSHLKLDSWIDIDFWVENSVWVTNSEIIFLSENAKFSWTPWLKVATNSVKANHSMKIDKISNESIFYLQARWIEADISKNLLLKAKLDELYKYFKLCNHSLYEKVILEIF